MLPPALKTTLEKSLGSIDRSIPVGGGDISSAARVSLADGREVLVKWRVNVPPGLFTAERRGLELLRSANALRIPKVIAQQEAAEGNPAFIAMEWLGRGRHNREVDEALGRGLAQIHHTIAQSYGLDHDNFIGANPQPNQQADDWLTFFGEQRLGFQMELAAKKGRLPRHRARMLNKLLAGLGDLLPAHPLASLLHGDLWGGNWITTESGEPALIDPAVYYGDREAELAFTELFGGFSGRFYEAYHQSWPLDSGYQQRKDIYNLYHLLNHLNLFGESYGGSVDAVLRQYTS